MKVIKPGNIGDLDNSWETEVVCEKKDRVDQIGCGAVLSITAQDLLMMHFFGAIFCHYYSAVRCPQCGKYNRVKTPDLVWEKFNTAANQKKSIFDGFDDRQ